ncbi:hypothetical protein ACFPMF_27605 [Larkinella bovis]|uniref:Uncharacterized protein n=1 Tax=Larkinella bovis TaxID=683041 RepID=A0ABW0IJM0_9BACT
MQRIIYYLQVWLLKLSHPLVLLGLLCLLISLLVYLSWDMARLKRLEKEEAERLKAFWKALSDPDED